MKVNATADSRRAGRELVLELVFRPLSDVLVPFLVRTRIPPAAVVLTNAAAGLLAALVLTRGELIPAAALLQLKTLLDNCDGQLARVTGRVTLVGRYLDTEADLVVNAAVFAALGHVTGQPVLAAAAFVALTLVLAVDFNTTEAYREARGVVSERLVSTGNRRERALARGYELVYAPLDRGSRRLWQGVEIDGLTVTALANLGLSTQLAVLGVCLALDVPQAYLWFAVAGLLVVVSLRVRAERRTRRLREA
jgi:phosphatidylglycerophosphate synthase